MGLLDVIAADILDKSVDCQRYEKLLPEKGDFTRLTPP